METKETHKERSNRTESSQRVKMEKKASSENQFWEAETFLSPQLC